MEARWTLITKMWEKEHQWLYGIAGLLSGFVLGLASSGVLAGWFVWFAENFWSEALGIAITVIVIDRLYRNRDRENLKRQLIRNAKSNIRDVAVHAIDELRAEGWLTGENGVLQGQDMIEANLEKARLSEASLQEATLTGGNLQGAMLWQVNLQGADMIFANLQGANLLCANLQEVTLVGANLQEANLSRASLQQADLRGADMLGVDLREANLQGLWLDETAKFDEKTILPDAEFIGSDENDYPLYDKHWTPDTDMSRYTDPNHPDFWQPEWAKKRHGDSQQQ